MLCTPIYEKTNSYIQSNTSINSSINWNHKFQPKSFLYTYIHLIQAIIIYICLQSFWQWWGTRGLYGPQGVTGDVSCFFVLTPLCCAATYLCGLGARAYARFGVWESTGLAVLCSMLVVTYFLWLFVTIRYVCRYTFIILCEVFGKVSWSGDFALESV